MLVLFTVAATATGCLYILDPNDVAGGAGLGAVGVLLILLNVLVVLCIIGLIAYVGQVRQKPLQRKRGSTAKLGGQKCEVLCNGSNSALLGQQRGSIQAL